MRACNRARGRLSSVVFVTTSYVSAHTKSVTSMNDDYDGIWLGPHSSAVIAVAMSPDMTRVVSVGEDNAICLWDTITRTAVNELFIGDCGVRSAAISADLTT